MFWLRCRRSDAMEICGVILFAAAPFGGYWRAIGGYRRNSGHGVAVRRLSYDSGGVLATAAPFGGYRSAATVFWPMRPRSEAIIGPRRCSGCGGDVRRLSEPGGGVWSLLRSILDIMMLLEELR